MFRQAVLAGFAIASALAQEPLARVNTRLVEVDAVVRGKRGALPDLKVSDFTVLDKGKPQRIATFSVYNKSTPSQATPQDRFRSNRLYSDGGAPKGMTVILLDMMNMSSDHQAEVRRQVAKYLHDHGNEDHLALYAMNKTMSVLQDFNDDPDLIARQVTAYHPQTSVDFVAPDLVYDLPVTGDAITDGMIQNAASEMQDNARLRRVEATVSGLRAIAKHLGGVPGRKKLIWFTESFPARVSDIRSHNGSPTIEIFDYDSYIIKAAEALNNANVAVYAIDPRDPYNGGFTAPGIDTMNLFADRTGGKAQYVVSDLEAAMRTVVEDDEVTYVLGFYPDDSKLDGTYHNLSVKVDRSGVEIRARKGYFASDAKPVPDKLRKEAVDEVFSGPLEATDLGLAAAVSPLQGRPGVYRLDLRLNVNELHFEQETAKNGAPVWIALIRVATKFPGKTKPNGATEDIKLTLTEARLKQTLQEGLLFSRAVALKEPGDLRVAIQDRNTGDIGSIKIALR